MKQVFPEFYKFSSEEYKEMFNDCYFIIDTNVLLNLYRYSEATRNELLGLLERIKDKLWMPYQVGLEFHFNRVSVILEQKMAYENICNKIDSQANDFITNLKKGFNNRHPRIQIDSITRQIRNSFDLLINNLKKHEEEHPNLLNDDGILVTLNQMYEGKVGEPYPKEELEKIYGEGERRYQKKFPPGYEDEKTKKDRTKEYDGIIYKDKFGDLVVWKQILDKAKVDQKTIIFVTDDVKEDWWEIEKGRTIGPRIELLNEFKKEANIPFYMYKTENFMSYIKEYLQEQVNKEAIKEMEDLRESSYYNELAKVNEYGDINEQLYINELAIVDEYGDINELYIHENREAERELSKRNNYDDMSPNEILERHTLERHTYWLQEIQRLNSKVERTFENVRPLLAEWNLHEFGNLRKDYLDINYKYKRRDCSINELQEHYKHLKTIYTSLREIYTRSMLKSRINPLILDTYYP
ncbi:hypothetical protein SAMN04488168_101487 [Bacillus sp. 491mf]|uniref:PIN-like domain-containing protein n=1 Tax=Bacillus sp. 491mf TaxID=1761755 RepID=UPI0008E1A60D|nr:PIN-like domain-containing protein [Bacillus sp. 491mf]SFC02334.1 hypothetical protein SAMN04488168_101487 [Bacillus sp. 491mf]